MNKVHSINTVSIEGIESVFVTEGTEGPFHDPYSYTEYSFEFGSVSLFIHLGLGESIKVISSKDEFEYEYTGYEEVKKIFTKYVNRSLETFMEQVQKELCPPEVCPNCKSEALEWIEGFPGESLLQCQQCKEIVDSKANLSAIE